MWHRVLPAMLQLQGNFSPGSASVIFKLKHVSGVVASFTTPSLSLPCRRTRDASAIPHHLTSLPPSNSSHFHHPHLWSFCATAALSSSIAPKPARSTSNNVTDAEWSEVEARLGEMAAAKKPSVSGVRRNEFKLMPIFLQRAGLPLERLASLKFIHVAGTKGKGSTCAMVESILRSCGYRTALYTSPHLVDVRERIRVNGQMLPRAEFATAFHQVFGALKAAAEKDGETGPGMPSFFNFMTIMAMHALVSRPSHLLPDVVVLEVGIGGRLDATTAVTCASSLAAAAITSLGFDHMELLGNTLPKIAGEKAGVMKPGRPVLVAPQEREAMQTLEEAALQGGARLVKPPSLESYRLAMTSNLHEDRLQPSSQNGSGELKVWVEDVRHVVGLGGAHMRMNAALAVALAAEWEAQYSATAPAAPRPAGSVDPATAAARAAAVQSLTLPAEYEAGLRTVSWPGRSQIVHDEIASSRGGHLTFYLDGAHTPESMAVCATWFAGELTKAAAVAAAAGGEGGDGDDGAADDGSQLRNPSGHSAVLLFNCMKERDPAVLLPALANALAAPAPALAVAANTSQCASALQKRISIDAAVFTPMLSGGGVLLPAHYNKQQEQQQRDLAKVGPATDLTWQLRMREVWDNVLEPPTSPRPDVNAPSPLMTTTSTPATAVSPGLRASGPNAALNVNVRLHGLPYASVAESLPAALEALRMAAISDPRIHVHVLVTGSLYLIGDMLRLLNKPPH